MATWITGAEKQVIMVARLMAQDGLSFIQATNSVGVEWSGTQFVKIATKLASNPAVGQSTRAILTEAITVEAGAGAAAAGAGAGTTATAAGSGGSSSLGGIVLRTAITWAAYAAFVLGTSYLLASKIGSVQCHVVVKNGVRSSCQCINDDWIPDFIVNSMKSDACRRLS